MTGLPWGELGVGGIFAVLVIKEVVPLIRPKNGTLKRGEFERHCVAVETLMRDDPPRLHTDLLKELVRETKVNGEKLDCVIEAVKNGRR